MLELVTNRNLLFKTQVSETKLHLYNTGMLCGFNQQVKDVLEKKKDMC